MPRKAGTQAGEDRSRALPLQQLLMLRMARCICMYYLTCFFSKFVKTTVSWDLTAVFRRSHSQHAGKGFWGFKVVRAAGFSGLGLGVGFAALELCGSCGFITLGFAVLRLWVLWGLGLLVACAFQSLRVCHTARRSKVSRISVWNPQARMLVREQGPDFRQLTCCSHLGQPRFSIPTKKLATFWWLGVSRFNGTLQGARNESVLTALHLYARCGGCRVWVGRGYKSRKFYSLRSHATAVVCRQKGRK